MGISVAELAEGRRRGGSGGASSTTSVGTGISVSLLAEGRQRGGSGGAFFGIGGASGGGSPSDRRLREKGGSPWTHQGPPAQRKSRTPSRTIHKPSAETKTHDGRRSRLRTAGGGEGKPALLVVSRTGYGREEKPALLVVDIITTATWAYGERAGEQTVYVLWLEVSHI